MKKDYGSKKKAAIAALSLVAFCLAGGLFYYVSTLNDTVPPNPAENTPTVETEVIVPEIKTEDLPAASMPETSTAPESNPAEEAGKEQNEPTGSTTSADNGDTVEKPSGGKPKSPTEATPPAKPPVSTESAAPVENPDESGNCQPEQVPQPDPEQPQGGEKENGKIYVPGFGWIEDEGGGSNVHEAPNAGTGKPVGDM